MNPRPGIDSNTRHLHVVVRWPSKAVEIRFGPSPTTALEGHRTKADRLFERSKAFTLVELLVAIVIVTILASSVLFAMAGVMENARIERTRSQINRLHELIADKWESYETRRVKIDTRGLPPKAASLQRLKALRATIRMELPDRYSDITFEPTNIVRDLSGVTGLTHPSLWHTYRRRFQTVFGAFPEEVISDKNDSITANQGAEMLYLIVSQMQDGNASALEFFRESEIGDTDQDGMPEILDGWGNPIRFLRWAPGFPGNQLQSPLQPDAGFSVVPNPVSSPDPFDHRGVHNDVDFRTAFEGTALFNPQLTTRSFALFPLIYSAGPDKALDTVVFDDTSPYPNDPYFNPDPNGDDQRAGSPWDTNQNGTLENLDNITNHFAGT